VLHCPYCQGIDIVVVSLDSVYGGKRSFDALLADCEV